MTELKTYITTVASMRFLLINIFVAVGYTIMALLGSSMALPPGYVSPLWPAAGVALAAILVYGHRSWPGIFIGATLYNFSLSLSFTGLVIGLCIGIASTVQALLGAWLTRRYISGSAVLSSQKNVWRFLLLAPLACSVASTIGVVTLYWAELLVPEELISQWLAFWVGDSLGVILITPLLLLLLPGTHRFWQQSRAHVGFPLLVVSALLIFGHVELNNYEESRERFETRRVMASAFENEFMPLLSITGPLLGVERFFVASKRVERDEFELYSREVLEHPGIIAVEWVQRVPAAERKVFEVLENTGIVEIGADGKRSSAADRAEYYPVTYIEPMSGNEPAMGFDLGSEPHRNAAMSRARDTGKPAAAPPLRLVQTGAPGLVVFVPVYTGRFDHKTATVEARRAALRGFVLGVIDVAKMFAPMLETLGDTDLLIRVEDKTDPEVSHTLVDTIFSSMPVAWEHDVEFAGRSWKVTMQSDKPRWQALDSFNARLFIFFSLLAALLVSASTLIGAGRNFSTALEVEKRTRELEDELQARKSAELNLTHTQALLENAMQISDMADWELDVDNMEFIFNDRFYELFATSAAREGGYRMPTKIFFEEFCHPDDRGMPLLQGIPGLDTTKPTDGVQQLENRIVRRDGAIRHMLIRFSVVTDSSGQIIKTQGSNQDITNLKNIEAALNRSNEELRLAINKADKANLAKSEFLAAMSHEIRTPMNGVISLIEMLEHNGLLEHQVESVNLIRESADALLTIIDDILDFSKIEAGKLVTENLPLSVEQVVEKVCHLHDVLSRQKNVQLSLFTDPVIPRRVLGDSLRLAQILTNLVNNAVKFSEGQGKPGQVLVQAREFGRNMEKVIVEFRVRDNGIGMSEETMAKLYTSFSQYDSSTTRRFGGTGLGLAITHSLVKLMGGEISVQSELDKGSTFSVRIPFELQEADSATDETEVSLAGLNCLVTGEQDSSADNFTGYLKHAGVQVVRVRDMPSAQEWARACPAGLWLCVIVDDANVLATEGLRSVAASCPQLDLRVLHVEHGKRRRLRRHAKDLLSIDAEVLSRHVFLEAVAVAGGLIEDTAMQKSRLSDGIVTPIIPAERLRPGQLILLAEDNEINQKVIQRQLAMLGFTAVIADNGHEALACLEKRDYVLLLTDLHMPDMDGYQLTVALRERESEGQHLPIIALTANALQGEREHCLSLGMDDYLSKPIRLAELKAMLDRWLPPDSNTGNTASVPVEAPVPEKTESPFNLCVLEDLIGNDPTVIRDLLNEFQISATRTAAELTRACAERRPEETGLIAHKLKGSAYTVGATKLGDLCARIEQAVKTEPAEAMDHLLPCFELEMANVNKYLDTLL